MLDRIEASVNSGPILLSDVRKFRQSIGIRTQLDPLFAGTAIAKKGAAATEAEIIAYLTDEKIITQKFEIGDAEVEQNINSIQTSNKIDRAGLKSLLKNEGISFDEYFELMRISSAKKELIEREIRGKVAITNDDVKNEYYSRYSKSAKAPRSYQIKAITISNSTFKTPAAAKDAALNALKAIRGGEAFEEVAKRASDDSNAQNGGELGTMTEDQMSPIIRAELKKLRIGGVSDVVTNPGIGYMIFKLANIESGESAQYEKKAEEIRASLATNEYQRQIELWLERERQKAFIHKAGEDPLAAFKARKSAK